MTSLALPSQLDRRTAEYLHREISKVTRGSHYEFASNAIGRKVDSLCQVCTLELVTLVGAINTAAKPTRLEVAPVVAPVAPKLEGWALVERYNADPSSLTAAQITAACTFLLS